MSPRKSLEMIVSPRGESTKNIEIDMAELRGFAPWRLVKRDRKVDSGRVVT